MDIGERIKTRRKELGITQDRLAQKIGLSNKSSVSLIEHGHMDLSTKQLIALAEALDVTVTWLLGIQPETVYIHEYEPLVKAYKRADKETQMVVRRILGIKKEDLDKSITSAS